MKKKIKKKWLKALRSGEYKQGKKFLRTDSGFCCLGVLCDLYRKETGERRWGKKTPYGEFPFCGETRTLPLEVIVWSGIHCSNPIMKYNKKNPYEYDTLAGLNDCGITFSEIADIIENQL